jgi:peptidoglycan hydrolase-like protein with peptidoglycan-binding domain
MTGNRNITFEQLRSIERRFNLPQNILWAMSQVESSGDPLALGDGDKSMGRFQILTGRGGGAEELRTYVPEFRNFIPGQDCEVDARAAATLLRRNDTAYLRNTSDNIALMLAAYNAGGGRVNERGFNAADGAPYNYVTKYVGVLLQNGYPETAERIIRDAQALPSNMIDINRFYARSYRRVASRDEIIELQTALRDAGYNPGSIDGRMGEQTMNAAIREARASGNGGLIYRALQSEIEESQPRQSEGVSAPRGRRLPATSPTTPTTPSRAAQPRTNDNIADSFNAEDKAQLQDIARGLLCLAAHTALPTAPLRMLNGTQAAFELQRNLEAADLATDRNGANRRVDGIIGTKSREAIRVVERALGITEDGIMDQTVQTALRDPNFRNSLRAMVRDEAQDHNASDRVLTPPQDIVPARSRPNLADRMFL